VLLCTCRQKTVVREGVTFTATLSTPALLYASLHLQGHLVIAGVLRTAIKETNCTCNGELI
jgi:hypothetical protein